MLRRRARGGGDSRWGSSGLQAGLVIPGCPECQWLPPAWPGEGAWRTEMENVFVWSDKGRMPYFTRNLSYLGILSPTYNLTTCFRCLSKRRVLSHVFWGLCGSERSLFVPLLRGGALFWGTESGVFLVGRVVTAPLWKSRRPTRLRFSSVSSSLGVTFSEWW